MATNGKEVEKMNVAIITNRPESHIVNYTSSGLASEAERVYVNTLSYDDTNIWLELHYNLIILDVDHLGSVRTLKIIKTLLKKGVHLADITDLETEYEKTD